MTREHTLKTLHRWRSFGEAQRAADHQKANAEVQTRQADCNAQRERVDAISARRADLLAQPVLDLALIEYAARFESDVRRIEAELKDQVLEAEQARDLARIRHVDAKAELRIAENALSSVQADAARALQLLDYDRLSDLLAGSAA